CHLQYSDVVLRSQERVIVAVPARQGDVPLAINNPLSRPKIDRHQQSVCWGKPGDHQADSDQHQGSNPLAPVPECTHDEPKTPNGDHRQTGQVDVQGIAIHLRQRTSTRVYIVAKFPVFASLTHAFWESAVQRLRAAQVPENIRDRVEELGDSGLKEAANGTDPEGI